MCGAGEVHTAKPSWRSNSARWSSALRFLSRAAASSSTSMSTWSQSTAENASQNRTHWDPTPAQSPVQSRMEPADIAARSVRSGAPYCSSSCVVLQRSQAVHHSHSSTEQRGRRNAPVSWARVHPVESNQVAGVGSVSGTRRAAAVVSMALAIVLAAVIIGSSSPVTSALSDGEINSSVICSHRTHPLSGAQAHVPWSWPICF